MRKKIVCFALIFALFVSAATIESRAEIGVSALSCVLIDADTKEILFEKNAHKELAMASTTKIMTALLTLENENKNEQFTVDSKAIRVEGSSMGLIEGDSVCLKTLAIGMLMLSGNDAANAAAVKIAGDTASFCKLMNDRAKKIGMKNTVFETPSGLDSENHHSTAYDMALLGAEAIKNSEFVEICSKSKYTVTFGKTPQSRTFYNHNRLVKEIDGCIGIKTGFTKKAGRCLVSAVKRFGRTLVCVTLKAPNDWQDHKSLYNYGFSLYEKTEIDLSALQDLKIVNSQKESVAVLPLERAELYIKKGEKIEIKRYTRPFEYAPVYSGDVVGSLCLKVGDVEVFKTSLLAGESAYLKDVKEQKEQGFFKKLVDFFKALFK